MITLGKSGELLGQSNSELFKSAEAVLKEWQGNGVIHFTSSGSTGKPKPIVFSKKQVMASIELSNQFFGLDKMSKVLCPLGLEYVAGKMMLLRALHLGIELDLCSAQELPENLSKYDFSPLVPLQLEKLLQEKKALPKKVLLGGAAINDTILTALKSENPVATIYHGYGMTETLTHVAMRHIHPKYEEGFTALPGIQITLNDEGCIKINAAHLGAQPILTTDLATISPQGSFKLLGRADFIINSGGRKINPFELEKAFEPFIDQPFFIHGIPDDKLGQQAVIFIEGDVDHHLEDLLRCVPTLHKYSQPKAIKVLPKFSRSSSGKIQRLKTVESQFN